MPRVSERADERGRANERASEWPILHCAVSDGSIPPCLVNLNFKNNFISFPKPDETSDSVCTSPKFSQKILTIHLAKMKKNLTSTPWVQRCVPVCSSSSSSTRGYNNASSSALHPPLPPPPPPPVGTTMRPRLLFLLLFLLLLHL